MNNSKNARKLIGFIMTISLMALITESALFMKIAFQGNDIVIILSIFGLTAGTFFGANVGEHFAAKGLLKGVENIIPTTEMKEK